MSVVFFPVASLPGIAYPKSRSPGLNTIIESSDSGREVRWAQQFIPTYSYKLKYNFVDLRYLSPLPNLNDLFAFFTARRGSWDTFYFRDPDFFNVPSTSPQWFGNADGTTTKFQLVVRMGSVFDPVQSPCGGTDPNGGTIQQAGDSFITVYDNGTPTAAYTLDQFGVVTFTTAPALGHTLTWSGIFYQYCRFDQDKLEGIEFAWNLWDFSDVLFHTVPR